jgi:hypothetical protein
MPKATHTDTTPAPNLAPVASGRRGLLGGAAALLASAAATTPRVSVAAGDDPVLALWRQYNDLLRQQEPVSASAGALNAALTARWGKAGMATSPAAVLWGRDPRYAELRRLIGESDRLMGLICNTSDAMVHTPAQSAAGLRAKIQLAISLYPTYPDWLEEADYQDWFAIAALGDADRLLASRGELVA